VNRSTQSSPEVFDRGTTTTNGSSERELNPDETSVPFMALALLIASALPIVAAIVLLLSEAFGRSLLSSLRFGWKVPPTSGWEFHPDRVTSVTYTWSIALIVIGVLQGAGAVFMGLSVFDPVGFAVRMLGAMLLEVVVFVFLNRHDPRDNPERNEVEIDAQ